MTVMSNPCKINTPDRNTGKSSQKYYIRPFQFLSTLLASLEKSFSNLCTHPSILPTVPQSMFRNPTLVVYSLLHDYTEGIIPSLTVLLLVVYESVVCGHKCNVVGGGHDSVGAVGHYSVSGGMVMTVSVLLVMIVLVMVFMTVLGCWSLQC